MSQSPPATSTPATSKLTARLGLALVLALLVGCFGILIASSHGSTVAEPRSVAAASSR